VTFAADATAQVDATLPIGGGKRVALTPASLCVEVRSGKEWRAVRLIGYGEIAAAYRYEVRDWGYLGLGLLYGLTLLAVVLFAALLAQFDGLIAWAMAGVVTVCTLALIAYRVAAVPRRWLRIETHTGPLLLPGREEAFFTQLAARLTPPAEPPTSAVPTPAAIPPAPPPPA
jgi:hypothetical protein